MPESAQSGSSSSATACAEPAAAGAHRLAGLTIFHHWDGERMVVSVRGDLDLRNDQRLDSALRPLLLASDGSIDLDLDHVDHCDCSAVNILLNVDLPATDADVSGATDGGVAATGAPPGPVGRADDPDADLSREVGQLRRAMRSRGTIDMARGVLVAAFGLSPDDAWSALVDVSQRTNIKLHLVARHLIDSTTGAAPLPKSVQSQLSAVIARRGDGARPDIPAQQVEHTEPSDPLADPGWDWHGAGQEGGTQRWGDPMGAGAPGSATDAG